MAKNKKYITLTSVLSSQLEGIRGKEAEKAYTTDEKKFYYWDVETDQWRLEASLNGGGGESQWSNVEGGISYSDQVFINGALYFGTSFISKGTFDNSLGGNFGVSLTCTVGFELNWQAGHLSSSYSGGNLTNLYIDSPTIITSNDSSQDGFGFTQLRILSNQTECGLTINNTSDSGRNYVISSTGSGSGAGIGNLIIADATEGVIRILINSDGKVGINTNLPEAQLHIEGSTKMNGAVYKKVLVLDDNDYSVADDDYIISLKNWTDNHTLTLPDPTEFPNRELIIFKGCQFQPKFNYDILQYNGNSFQLNTAAYATVSIISDGSTWFLLSQDSNAIPD